MPIDANDTNDKDPIDADLAKAFKQAFDEADNIFWNGTTATNTKPADNEPLTIEKLQEVMREINEAVMAAELDVFLSDRWPIYKALKQGAKLVQAPDGKWYLCSVDLAEPFGWDLPRSFPTRFDPKE